MHSPTASTRSLKAALWDMDGTLVDTELYWIRAESELVASHGGHWDTQLAHQLVGNSLESTASVLQNAGVDLTVAQIVDRLTASVVSDVQKKLPWRPGARELLADLHAQGVRNVLVTMSWLPLARVVAEALDEDYFEFLVTGEQVSHGKPHPEPYLRAIERLRERDPLLKAENCVALEDSVPGVASAMAAQVTTIGVPHIVPLPDDPNRTTWASLEGKTYDDVASVLLRGKPVAPEVH